MVVDAKDPQVFVENLDFLYWTRMDQFLVTWLIGFISETMLGHVIRCTSAVEIQSTLHEVFGIQSKVIILQLRQQLQLKKCATPVEEYVLKKCTLANCLIAVGQPIYDDEVCQEFQANPTYGNHLRGGVNRVIISFSQI